MKQIRITVAAVLGAFTVLFAVSYVLLFSSGELMAPTEDLGEGLSRVFGVLLSVIPLFLGIPAIVGIIVLTVCIFVLKKKLPPAVALLILMTLYLPVVGFSAVVMVEVYLSQFLALALAAGGMAAVYLAAYVVTCIYVHLCRTRGDLQE